MAYVVAWRDAGRPPRTVAHLSPIIRDVAAARKEPSPNARTVLRWISAWLEGGEQTEALLPDHGGNRDDRLGSEARDLLRQTVEQHFLVETRPTAVAVHRAVAVAFERRNAGLPADERLTVPSLKATYAQIEQIDRYTIDFCRLGKRSADLKWRPVGEGPLTTRHNEAWEMDHTLVDAIVVDEASGFPIGRPWVTVAIDRHTRVIAGFRIGFEPPSAESALECMRVAIAPKDPLLAGEPGVLGQWPCFGVPERLIVDNGKEFRSRAFLDACLRLGMDVEFMPVLKAWYKGRVERFFGTLARDVFHKVPGTTFANIFERGKEAIPERVAVTTLRELRNLVTRWVVDVYHARPHRSLAKNTPLTLWNESCGKHGIRLPPSPDEVALATATVVWRIPQRYGLEFEGLLYNSPDVAGLRIRTVRPEPVKVRVNGDDLTRVWMIDPTTRVKHTWCRLSAVPPLG